MSPPPSRRWLVCRIVFGVPPRHRGRFVLSNRIRRGERQPARPVVDLRPSSPRRTLVRCRPGTRIGGLHPPIRLPHSPPASGSRSLAVQAVRRDSGHPVRLDSLTYEFTVRLGRVEAGATHRHSVVRTCRDSARRADRWESMRPTPTWRSSLPTDRPARVRSARDSLPGIPVRGWDNRPFPSSHRVGSGIVAGRLGAVIGVVAGRGRIGIGRAGRVRPRVLSAADLHQRVEGAVEARPQPEVIAPLQLAAPFGSIEH